MRFATKAIRIGQDPEREHKSVTYPIYQTATFAWDQCEAEPPIAYSRVANPNRNVLEEVIAGLENGSFCTVFASGMAAAVAALSQLQNGDHVLYSSDLYGGTHRYIESILPRSGVTCSVFDSMRPETIAEVVQPNSKMLVFESPTNPLLRVCDIRAIVAEAKKYGLVTLFDNTFASPSLQNPLDLGLDIVLHSTTKYISGHSDVIGGALVTNSRAHALTATEWIKNTGAAPSPFDCWLSLRGLKTLALRMERHCENAQAVAEYLAGRPDVDQVFYPGLADSPYREVAQSQMRGFGGMLSFTIGNAEFAKSVATHTQMFLLAESLGGVESLIGYPTLMSHGCLEEDQRLERGVTPNLLRLSVGIEDVRDLIDDLDQAITKAHSEYPAAVSASR